MDERKNDTLTLSQIRRNKPDLDNMKEIKVDSVSSISEQAKAKEKKEVIDRKNKIKEDEILKKCDNRIEELKKESIEFNRLKYEEIQRRKDEKKLSKGNDIDTEDYDIPMFDSEDYYDEKEKEIDIVDNNDVITDKLNIVDDGKTITTINIKDKPNQQENIKIIENNKIDIVDENKLDNRSKNNINNNEFIDKPQNGLVFDDKDFEHLEEEKENKEDDDYIKESDLHLPKENSDNQESSEEDIKEISFTEEQLQNLYDDCKSIIKGITKPSIVTDISSFTIGPSINSNNAYIPKSKDVCEHVLWNEKRTIAMEEFEGYEVNLLCSDYDPNRSMYTQLKERLTIIYNHIKSKKPADVTTWLKNTPDTDYNHLWMCVYIASFANANFNANQCDNCHAPFISEDIPIRQDMFRFENKEAEEKYDSLINSPDDSLYTIEAKGYRISEDYLFMLKTPSIWSANLEPLMLPEEFRNKYARIINAIKFIDKIYFVDKEKHQLRPIDFSIDKKVDNRAVKTLQNKIRKYGEIICHKLSVLEYNRLMTKISGILLEEETGLQYQLPERKCPHCNKVIESQVYPAEQLLFTHHQQVLLGNI